MKPHKGQQATGGLKRRILHGHAIEGAPSAEYRCWSGMLARCMDPKAAYFHRYGGRGIAVCERWLDFRNFLADMGERPSSGHSIDRINNDGNYEPSNCRWATLSEQSRNKAATVRLQIDGVTLSLPDWADRARIPGSLIRSRLRSGWPVKLAVLTPHLSPQESGQRAGRASTASRLLNPPPPPGPRYTDEARVAAFWARVAPADGNGCRPWLGNQCKGHGRAFFCGRMMPAHGIAWRLTYQGPVMPNPVYRHLCGVSACVEPSHVYPGSQAQKIADMMERDRHQRIRFSEEQLREIAYSKNAAHRIAAQLGVSLSTIRRIKQRKWCLKVSPLRPLMEALYR